MWQPCGSITIALVIKQDSRVGSGSGSDTRGGSGGGNRFGGGGGSSIKY